MVSQRQEKMIGLALAHFKDVEKEMAKKQGRDPENVIATPRQIWRWISSNYKAHGFKSQMSVAHAMKALRNRRYGD